MKKELLIVALFMFAFTAVHAQQDRFWSASQVDRSTVETDKAVARLSFPKEFQLFDLNANILKQALFAVAGAKGSSPSTVISLPNAKGKLEQFEVYEASNFEPALQEQFPEIRAYSGRGITDKYATLKLSISPQGIQTMVFRTETDNEFIEPYSKDHRIYAVFTSHREMGKLPWTCSTEEQAMAKNIDNQVDNTASATGNSTGQIKTLRLAQSCNGEYANYFGATSSSQVGLVMAAFNATLTRCNGVYEKDLALHLNLIANTTAVIYYNPQSDPYSTRLSRWNSELQSTLTSVIGEANYDIGHMFGASGGGGNAGCIGCVCVNGSKGSGITSPADGIPEGDNFDIDYVAHEVGHQLGGNHTFSMSLEGTGQNKEVGSGITIMGYAGITAQDVARHSIDIFHETTIAQIQANMATKSCPVTINMTANHAPVVTGPGNYTIPISTPFALTGNASDPDNDSITYNWEQNDNSTTSGSGSVASPTKTTGPNWLSFPSTATPTRLFPRLSTILAGLNVTGPLPGGDAGANIEALSSVSRTLNFRLTVRDNHPYVAGSAIGQTAFTDAVVTVTNTSGPFAVTAPNTNVTWNAGSTATVTWSVNGTNGGPVNCASVNILLSTDGGNTFPIVLAAGTPNDGSQVINVPATTGSTNRVKVEAVGNIFFDISNTNFTISGAVACGNPASLSASAITQTSATVSWNAVSGAVSYDVDYKAASSGTWISAAAGSSATNVNLSGLSASTLYDWRVRANCASASSSFTAAQFTTAAAPACGVPTNLVSSAITQTSATLSWAAVSGANSYDVDYKTTASGTWISAAAATSLTSVNLSGLAAGTTYDWRVRTNCSAASSSYAQTQFTTSAAAGCGAATGLAASAITQTNATLSWNGVSGANSYTVDYKDASSATWLNAVSGTSATSVNLPGLTASTTYDWRVQATCASATGSYAQSQFSTIAEPSACPGIYDVSTNSSTSGAATIPLNTDIYGLIDVRGNSDYYKFTINTGGTITLSLTNLPADYQLALLAGNGSTLQSSTNSSTSDEMITATVAAGTYYARIYPKNNGQMNASNCYTLRVETGSANRDMIVSAGSQMQVSPNPASSNANIQFRLPQGGFAIVTVFNQAGRVMQTKTLAVSAGNNSRKLDVGNLPSGTYFVKIQSGGVVQMAKLVVGK